MRKLRRRGWEVGTVKFVVFTEMSFVETRFEAVTCDEWTKDKKKSKRG